MDILRSTSPRDANLAVTQQMVDGGARSGWMVYFHVDDVDASRGIIRFTQPD